MQREGFVFYRSFYEAIKDLPPETKAGAYDAIMTFALYGQEQELSDPVARAIFMLVKPQIIANNNRWENGRKGGRPKNRNKTEKEPSQNQNETTGEPKEKEKEKEKEKDKAKDKETTKTVSLAAGSSETKPEPKEPKSKFGKYKKVLLTAEEAAKIAENPQGAALIAYLDEYIERKGYKAKSHYLCLLGWVTKALAEQNAKSGRAGSSGFKTNAQKLKEQEDKLLQELQGGQPSEK